jgi:hypothetical protein
MARGYLPLRASGLRLGEWELEVAVEADGTTRVSGLPEGSVRVE